MKEFLTSSEMFMIYEIVAAYVFVFAFLIRGCDKKALPHYPRAYSPGLTILVSGGRYRGPEGIPRQSLYKVLHPGEELVLVPEPNNPRDSNAVAVVRLETGRTMHLGHIPAELTARVSGNLAQGLGYRCTVFQLIPDKYDTWSKALLIDLEFYG